jgi:hypothetical protein
LLMFVVLFGSLLAAYALAQVFAGKMRVGHLALLVLAAGWSASPYLSPHHADKTLSIEKEMATPDVGRGGATYCYRPGAACLLATTQLHAEMDWVDPRTGGAIDMMEFHLFGKLWGAFPAPVAGDALVLHGTVVPGGKVPLRLTVSVDNAVLATRDLQAGPFELTLPLSPAPGKDRIRVVVQGEPQAELMEPPGRIRKLSPSYLLSKFALLPGPGRPAGPKLIPESEVFGQMRWGRWTVLRLHVAEPTLVQLPILYYPNMVRVEDNGQHVAAEHLGRRVALELQPGDHEIRVRVAGVSWANGASLAAWIAVALAGVWLCGRAWRRRLSQAATVGAGRPHVFWIRSVRQSRVAD